MGKYDPLKGFLRNQHAERVQLTFAEIEELIQSKLPESKRYPAWWSNNPSNNTMTRVWLDAGFMTEQVDIGAGRLVFRRTATNSPKARRAGRYPGFGAMKGTVHVPSGVDLAEPADPEWSKTHG